MENGNDRVRLDGVHHVTAITADARRCVDFYAGLLGLERLDASLAYEPAAAAVVSFGDPLAQPGAILNLIELSGARPGRTGAGTIHSIAWRVADAKTLRFWERRLSAAGVAARIAGGAGPDALPSLRFEGPDSLAHELVLDTSGDEPLCARSPGVPVRFALRGLDGVRAYGRTPVASADLLAGRLDFATDGAASYLIEGPSRRAHYAYDDPPGHRPVTGAGSVHHVAWSCDGGDERIWRQRVIGLGARITRTIEADYFRSIQFREPSGVLFEIATRGPVSAPVLATDARRAPGTVQPRESGAPDPIVPEDPRPCEPPTEESPALSSPA
jgi:glyoxalase family protein